MPVKPRDYQREYALYHGRPEQIRRRAQRNKSRRTLAKQGLVSKGDGMDVHHKNNNPFDQKRSNMGVITKELNRSIK